MIRPPPPFKNNILATVWLRWREAKAVMRTKEGNFYQWKSASSIFQTIPLSISSDFLICFLCFQKYSWVLGVFMKMTSVTQPLIQPHFIMHWPCVRDWVSGRKCTTPPTKEHSGKGRHVTYSMTGVTRGVGRKIRVALEKVPNQVLIQKGNAVDDRTKMIIKISQIPLAVIDCFL